MIGTFAAWNSFIASGFFSHPSSMVMKAIFSFVGIRAKFGALSPLGSVTLTGAGAGGNCGIRPRRFAGSAARAVDTDSGVCVPLTGTPAGADPVAPGAAAVVPGATPDPVVPGPPALPADSAVTGAVPGALAD